MYRRAMRLKWLWIPLLSGISVYWYTVFLASKEGSNPAWGTVVKNANWACIAPLIPGIPGFLSWGLFGYGIWDLNVDIGAFVQKSVSKTGDSLAS